MNYTNPFEGLDEHSIHAIQSKSRIAARRHHFTQSDVEDIEVELALHLRQQISKYDPARGRFRTFVSRVLDNRILVMVSERQTRYFNYEAVGIDDMLRDSDDELVVGDTVSEAEIEGLGGAGLCRSSDRISLRVDIERALQKLTPEQRELCLRLSESWSVSKIAGEMGMSRDTAYERKRQICRIFRRLGLDAYLGR